MARRLPQTPAKNSCKGNPVARLAPSALLVLLCGLLGIAPAGEAKKEDVVDAEVVDEGKK